MLKLAELLALSNFHVTFLNTDHNHRRLTRFSDIESRFSSCYGGLIQFKAVSDGYPLDHPEKTSASSCNPSMSRPDLCSEACSIPTSFAPRIWGNRGLIA